MKHSMVNRTLLYFFIAIALLLLLAWYFSNIFIYVTISLVLATVLRPLTNAINRFQLYKKNVPRVFAVFFSFTAIILIIVFFVGTFLPLITKQVEILSKIDYKNFYDKATIPLDYIEGLMRQYNLTDEAPGFLMETIRANFTDFVQQSSVGDFIEKLLSVTGNVMVGVMAVLFITFFLLYEKGRRRKQFISLIPNKYFEVVITAVYKIEKLLSNYLLGLLFQMFAIFSIAAIGLSIVGVKYAMTIALFAAVANLVPYAGPLLGATFGIVVGLSTGVSVTETQDLALLVIKIASVFAIVQLADNLLLQPLIFSKSVKAHPLEIFVVIFAGATIAGVWGMIAAIPAYTILRVTVLELYKGYKQYHVFKIKELI